MARRFALTLFFCALCSTAAASVTWAYSFAVSVKVNDGDSRFVLPALGQVPLPRQLSDWRCHVSTVQESDVSVSQSLVCASQRDGERTAEVECWRRQADFQQASVTIEDRRKTVSAILVLTCQTFAIPTGDHEP